MRPYHLDLVLPPDYAMQYLFSKANRIHANKGVQYCTLYIHLRAGHHLEEDGNQYERYSCQLRGKCVVNPREYLSWW